MLIDRLFYLKYLRKNPNSKRSWRKRPACAFRIIVFLIGNNPAQAERLCLSDNNIFNSKKAGASGTLVPFRIIIF